MTSLVLACFEIRTYRITYSKKTIAAYLLQNHAYLVHPDSVLTFRSVDFGNGINLHKLLRGNNINYEIFKI